MMLGVAIFYAVLGFFYIANGNNPGLQPWIQGILMINLAIVYVELYFLRQKVKEQKGVK